MPDLSVDLVDLEYYGMGSHTRLSGRQGRTDPSVT